MVGTFISDIVLQILSFVAQNERENIRQRQKEGIAIARLKGIHLGRPPFVCTPLFQRMLKKYQAKRCTIKEAQKTLGISRATFFKYARLYKEQT